jgi:hypothetical protein
LTSSPTTSSSLVTLFSTKMCFSLLAPPHPSISTPSLNPIRFPLYPRRPALRLYPCLMWLRRLCSHLYPCLTRPQRLRLCLFPRHARPRRPHLCHVRPRRRARLASSTLPSYTTVASAPLLQLLLTRPRRRVRPASPTPPSFSTVVSRPRPRLQTHRRPAPSPQCTTWLPYFADPEDVMVTRRAASVLRLVDRLILAADTTATRRPPLASRYGGVRAPAGQPHLGPSVASTRHQRGHQHVALSPQAEFRRLRLPLQGPLGPLGLHLVPRCVLRRDHQPRRQVCHHASRPLPHPLPGLGDSSIRHQECLPPRHSDGDCLLQLAHPASSTLLV